MKNLKLGLVAIVAVLAMSFTVASNKGAFKGTKFDAPQEGCWLTVDLTNQLLTATSTNASANPGAPSVQRSTSATIVFSGQPAIPLPQQVSGVTGSVNIQTSCPSPFNNFCCYEVTKQLNPVQYKVTAIIYRS